MGSMIELEKEVVELKETVKNLKQRMLTSELQAGLMYTNIIRMINEISPRQNATEVILNALKIGESKIPEIGGQNDPHIKDAYAQAIKSAERALKK
ncbi:MULTISPECIES: hypothetical protein [Yersinia]|uniref:hypothetical protein n=1 Tax=Yersinia TaxID=629 RepID=UPI0005DBBE72|nr:MULTISPECIES: hypothetical protein [Yersinia]CFR15002.1 Uncharacterised protein [Yersinia frederiksenii]